MSPGWQIYGAGPNSIQYNLLVFVPVFLFVFVFDSVFVFGGLIVLGICLQVGRYMERGLIRSNIIRHRIEFRLDSLSLSTIIPLTGKLTELDFNVSLAP